MGRERSKRKRCKLHGSQPSGSMEFCFWLLGATWELGGSRPSGSLGCFSGEALLVPGSGKVDFRAFELVWRWDFRIPRFLDLWSWFGGWIPYLAH